MIGYRRTLYCPCSSCDDYIIGLCTEKDSLYVCPECNQLYFEFFYKIPAR
jgi:hypothetical protein